MTTRIVILIWRVIYTLSMRSFSDGDAVGAATELIRVTGTTLVIWSSGRREAIWTATVRRVLAATTLVVWSTSGGAVVWTAAESRVLASAAVEIRTASWQYIVWTALERCRQTTTLSVRTVRWSATVVAAAISGVLAGHVAAVVVRAQSYVFIIFKKNLRQNFFEILFLLFNLLQHRDSVFISLFYFRK